MPLLGDENYWRDRYKSLWAISASREKNVLSLLKDAGFGDAVLSGLGAGSTRFLRGSPADYGKTKGDPDIQIPSLEVDVEVTGSDKSTVKISSELWVRPDKIENARDHPERDTWIVHCLDLEGVVRAIHLTRETIGKLLSMERIHPPIRGTEETYVSIDANDSSVVPFDSMLKQLKERKRRETRSGTTNV